MLFMLCIFAVACVLGHGFLMALIFLALPFLATRILPYDIGLF